MRSEAAVVAFVLTVGASALAPGEQRPVPAFDLMSADGAAVASSSLSTEPRWLLVYVSPDCRSCDRLISSVIDWQRTLPPNRIVLVIDGSSSAALSYAHDRGIADVTGITWYADPARHGRNALGLQYSPALVAVENGQLAWVVSGVLNDPQAVEQVVRGWMA